MPQARTTPQTREEEFAWRWENCAFHEAGHAVAFAAGDIEMEIARLLHVRHDPASVEGYVLVGDRALRNADPDAVVVGTLAGLYAQAVWYHRIAGFDRGAALRHAQDGARHGDLRLARRYLKHTTLTGSQARDATRRLVLQRWPAITRVANALITRAELTNREVHRYAD
jgi:hypothetical protein